MTGKFWLLVTHHFILVHQHLPYSIAWEYSTPQTGCVSIRFSGYQPVTAIGCTQICIRSIQKGVCVPPLCTCEWTEVADLGHRSVAGLEGQGILGSVLLMGMLTHKWTHWLFSRHTHKHLISHHMTASLDRPTVKKERLSLPTLVPQEAHRCWILLQVADVTTVQFTTTLILFY